MEYEAIEVHGRADHRDLAPRVEGDADSTYCFQKPIAIEPFIDLVKELAGDQAATSARR
jgi:hypothetical protein